uniref:Uncharacterized protein n=1 Tax=Aegilops tauschii subsp. strangulata TaxID=200361 RepID=A0A453KF36_AEGTS
MIMIGHISTRDLLPYFYLENLKGCSLSISIIKVLLFGRYSLFQGASHFSFKAILAIMELIIQQMLSFLWVTEIGS